MGNIQIYFWNKKILEKVLTYKKVVNVLIINWTKGIINVSALVNYRDKIAFFLIEREIRTSKREQLDKMFA